MKRRLFLKNTSLASLSVPVLFNGMDLQAFSKKYFSISKSAEDRILILIRLNGGNDGLNTVIPLSQYDNLMIQRPNLIIPENKIIGLDDNNGLHPAMGGIKNLFDSSKISIIQNVGYPMQNRSHFRSSDIWTHGSLTEDTRTGWMGRHLDGKHPNFPEDYPNDNFKDPFALSMGYEVSSTCQGTQGNFSHSVVDPLNPFNLEYGINSSDGSYFGDQVEYITTVISQTNEYGERIYNAASQGSTISDKYDESSSLAIHLRNIAKLITGGLKTNVYILNLNGFDTHSSQTEEGDSTLGLHAQLLKTLSDAIEAFQDDLKLLGIEDRVLGMTFSEFGRQIASNASLGTDHGDSAPLFLFGSCLAQSIIGQNPIISDQIIDQAGLPMNIDFRDLYASILKDWFKTPEDEINKIFEHEVNYYNLIHGCNDGLGVTNNKPKKSTSSKLYPNPSSDQLKVEVYSFSEKTQVYILSNIGNVITEVTDSQVLSKSKVYSCNITNLASGSYLVLISSPEHKEILKFVKH